MMGQRLLMAGLGLALMGCGTPATPSAGPPCTPRSAPPSPRAAVGTVVGVADRARVDPGGTVTFTESVGGPAKLTIDCQQPLAVIVADSAQLHVYSGRTTPVSRDRCGALTVAAGSTQSYSVAWAVDETLPGGAYAVTLLLGNAPQLTVSVAVGTIAAHC